MSILNAAVTWKAEGHLEHISLREALKRVWERAGWEYESDQRCPRHPLDPAFQEPHTCFCAHHMGRSGCEAGRIEFEIRKRLAFPEPKP